MTDLPLEHIHVAPDDGGAEGPDDGGAEGPAVAVLHGRGADEEDLLPVARRLPDELHVVSLRAPDRLQGGYTWYDLDVPDGDLHRSQPEPEGFARSRELVRESIDAAVDAYGLDPDRIGLLGFSQGAIASLALLLEDPDRYAWAVALHGYLAASHAGLAPDGVVGKPVFVGAGSADRIIPESRAAAAADRFREIGADVRSETYPVGHGVGEGELADVVAFVSERVAGGD